MIDAFMINLGGRVFTTLRSTLEQSPTLAAMLSNTWADNSCRADGVPFVDRSALLFEHILDFLQSSAPPIFWTRTNGFDLPLYTQQAIRPHAASSRTKSRRSLPTWIREEQYIKAIRITASLEVKSLSDCSDGMSHFGDIEKKFEAGCVSRSSDSGKTTIYSKRLLLRKTKLQLPVIANLLDASLN